MTNNQGKSNYIEAGRDMINIFEYYSIKLPDSFASLIISYSFNRKAKLERILAQCSNQ